MHLEIIARRVHCHPAAFDHNCGSLIKVELGIFSTYSSPSGSIVDSLAIYGHMMLKSLRPWPTKSLGPMQRSHLALFY